VARAGVVSVKATERAWESDASGNDLLVLLALADHAGGQDDPYGYAYPSVERLERMTRLSRRTVQRALRSLEEAGHIAQTGTHTWGRGKVTNIYAITGGRQDDAASPEARGGVIHDVGGASPVTPKPSIGTVKEPSTTARARAKRPDPDALPADFPAHLLPTLDELHSWLGRIADARGAPRPARAAIARAMVVRQAKGAATMLRVAERLEHWLTFGNGQRASCRDVVARWRDWLDQEPDVPERPAIAAMGPNVHAIRPPRRAIHSQAAMWDAMAVELEARERGDAG
jgi:hypothetical protein